MRRVLSNEAQTPNTFGSRCLPGPFGTGGGRLNLAHMSLIQSERRAEQEAKLKEIGDIFLRKAGGLMMDAVSRRCCSIL